MTEENAYLNFFDDAERVKHYTAGPPKFMPGFFAMHHMACVLLNEHIANDANILVHGAGGGLELESFAKFNKNWKFLGLDPALPMLEEAKRVLGPLNDRVTLQHGYIDDVSDVKFDAATSMLTLHVLEAKERERTILEIVSRLKPGAPFIAVHCSFPQDRKAMWLSRHRNYAVTSGINPETADKGRTMIESTLHTLNPEEDEAILRAAGLKDVTQFYSAFTWRGWIGYA